MFSTSWPCTATLCRNRFGAGAVQSSTSAMPPSNRELTAVAHLPAGLGVEGGAVQHHVALARKLLDPAAVQVEQGHDVALDSPGGRSP